MPRFTIALPVYNGERYVAESIESVLGQSFGDFELIVWDDASRDGTVDVVSRYHDPRLQLHRNPANAGLFPTLNRAIGAGTAPLVRLWSQDDRMKPECLAVEHEFWGRHPDLGMSYCLRDTIDEHGRRIHTAGVDTTPEVLSIADVAWISFFYGCMPGNIASVVMNRRAFDDVGGFREDLRVSGDFDLWLRIAERYATGFIARALIDLRDHGEQFSRRPDVVVDFMREDRQVLERIGRWLPSSLQPEAPRLNRRLRHVQYFHAMVVALARGDRPAARRIRQTLAEWDSPLLVALWWLASGNNRWFRVAPSYQAWRAAGREQRE